METKQLDELQIAHSMPGRTRLKFHHLKKNPHLASSIHRKLSSISGVHNVETNPSTGSVVVHHERTATESAEFLLALAAAFGLAAAEPEELGEWFQVLSNSSSNGAFDLLQGAKAVWEAFNSGIQQITGGRIDGKTLFPAILVMLGIRGLLVSDVLVAPKWYEYFWFAFGMYFTLNKPESPADAAT